MPMNNPTPEAALQNLSKVAELFQCDGPTRDLLRASVKVLEELIQARKVEALTEEKPATPPVS